jgi:hypothetical protein
MGKENGFEFTPKDGGIGQPDQKVNPYVPISTGDKMRRSSGQAKVFDNNGGDSKADGAGVVNKNGEYGPVTYGF